MREGYICSICIEVRRGRINMFSMYRGEEGKDKYVQYVKGKEGEDRFVQHVHWKGV